MSNMYIDADNMCNFNYRKAEEEQKKTQFDLFFCHVEMKRDQVN